MELATKDSINGKGKPVHSRLLYHEDEDRYYVEVHAPGFHQLVKVTDEESLQRWLKTFEEQEEN